MQFVTMQKFAQGSNHKIGIDDMQEVKLLSSQGWN